MDSIFLPRPTSNGMKVIVNGLATEYLDEGQGQILLLLHGWGDTHKSFDALATRLQQQFRIIRLDLPGFGESEMPREPWFVADYASFVQAFIERLGIEPRAAIGHSMGGRVIIKGTSLGILNPPRIVLVASAGNARRKTLRNFIFFLIAKIGKLLAPGMPRGVSYRLREKIYGLSGSDYLGAGDLSETFKNIIAEDLSADARQLNAPTLILWGSQDEITPLSDGKRLAAAIPNSRFVEMSGAGHFVHQERVDEVAKHITEFL